MSAGLVAGCSASAKRILASANVQTNNNTMGSIVILVYTVQYEMEQVILCCIQFFGRDYKRQ